MVLEDSRAIFKGHEREKLRAVMTSFPALRSTIFDFDELLNATLDIIEDQRLNGRDEEGVKQCLRRESLMLEQEIEQLRTLNDYLRTKLDCDLSPSFDDKQDEGTYDFLPPPADDEEEDSCEEDMDEDSETDDSDYPDPDEEEDLDEDSESDTDEDSDEDPDNRRSGDEEDSNSEEDSQEENEEEEEDDQPER